MKPFAVAKFFLSALLMLAGTIAGAEPLLLSFEQRLFVSTVLDAAMSSPQRQAALLSQWVSLKTQGGTAIEKVPVDSFEGFLKAWKGEWPETNSLSMDVNLALKSRPSLRRQFVASDPALQSRIDSYIADQPVKMLEVADPYLRQALTVASEASFDSKMSFEELLRSAPKLLAEQSTRLEEILGHAMEKAFSGAKDPLLRIGMKVIFSRYYSQLGFESKARLVSALLGADMRGDLQSFFGIFLQNAGPQVQKMVQVVARMGSLDPKISALFQTLESDVKPVPFSQVREIIEAESAYKFSSFEEKALGVGTMAQVHRAVLRKDGRDVPVVVRFLKPGIEKRVEEDHRILTAIAAELDRNPDLRASGLPKISPLVEEATNTVRAELNLDATISRQIEAKAAYETVRRVVSESRLPILISFHVPDVYRVPGGSALHVQEMVSGKKLEKVVKEMKSAVPDLEKLITQETGRLWIQEALFGSGFYHSDLHQGNFLVDVRETEFRISILDYGMAGKVPRAMQDQFVVLAASLALEKESTLTEAFLGLSDTAKNRLSREELRQAVAEEISQIASGRRPKRGLIEWTAFMVDHGVALSYDVINVNRGAAIVDQMLKDSGAAKGFSDLALDIAKRNPHRIIGALLRNGFSFKDLLRLGFDGKGVPLQTTKFGEKAAPSTPVRCDVVFGGATP